MAATVRKLRTATLASPGQLHDAALNARDEVIRLNLQIMHSEILDAMAAFAKAPSGANLRKLNGSWTHGARLLAFAARKNRERPNSVRG